MEATAYALPQKPDCLVGLQLLRPRLFVDWGLQQEREFKGKNTPPPPRTVCRTLKLRTHVHGDALCFMAKTWARHNTTETVLKNGWRLVAVGGG